MKVLFICKCIPYLRSNGIELKTYNLLQCMHEVADVSSLFVVEDAQLVNRTLSHLKKCDSCHVQKSSKSAPARYLKHLRDVVLVEKELKIRLGCIINEVRPDIIWLEFGYICSLIPFLKKYGIPVYYGSHNSQWELDFAIWKANKNRADQVKMAPFLILYWLQDRFIMGRADRFFCISTGDIEHYSRYVPREKLALLPFFFDCRGLEGVNSTAGEEPCICLVGSLRSFQNYQAALYTMEKVWPHITSVLKSLRLYIIGELPDAESQEYRLLMEKRRDDQAIVLTGKVESVIPYVKAALVNIVPLLLGSGVRTKIIESAACRTAVVSTTIGAEGLPFEHGKSIVIADAPREFADEVVRLVNDDNRRREIAESAFETYRRELSFEAGTAALARIFADCAGDGGGPARSARWKTGRKP